jgi:cobalt-zinc-cadmium efflux system outer membrane protein
MGSIRKVTIVSLALAVFVTVAPSARAGDLWDRLFHRKQRQAGDRPAVTLPATSDTQTTAGFDLPVNSGPRSQPAANTRPGATVVPVQYEMPSIGNQPPAAPSNAPQTFAQLTLDEAVRIAETKQPQLVAAAAAIDAARGRYRQARTYPNPTADVRGETLVRTEFVAGVEQPIILGQRRQRAIEAACRDIEAREREFDALRARVFLEVKQSFYQTVALQQLLDLAREQERNASTLVEKTRARFKEGDVAERDVLRAEVDLSNVHIQVENLERELTEARKMLATRMGVATASIVRCDGELKLPGRFASEEELTARLLSSHPELQAALAEVQFRSASVVQAQAERMPDATVTVLYRRLTETDQNTADVGISLPLPLFDRRTGRIEEAVGEASRAQARYDATQNDLIGQLRRAYESLLIYYRQTENYQTNILPKTDRSLELVRTAHEGGDVSILELLDAQRQSNAAHAAYLEVLSKLVQRWSEVEYLVQSHAPEPPSVR